MEGEGALVAISYLKAGLCPIPVKTDGSKRPLVSWKEFQIKLPTEERVRSWFSQQQSYGIAVICGAVSSGLEVLDFDDPGLLPAWTYLVDSQIDDLAARLPQVDTPAGGAHVYWRAPGFLEGNLKLAWREDGKIAVETRGEGGYVLAPGGAIAHESGKPYVHVAGPPITEVPTITAEEREVLLSSARALNRRVHTDAGNDGVSALNGDGRRPGDQFNRETKWDEVLAPVGWTIVRSVGDVQHWRRPGKNTPGISATSGYCKNESSGSLLYVFSSNAHPLAADRAYSKFSAYAMLIHGGDFSMAARSITLSGRVGPADVSVQAIVGATAPSKVIFDMQKDAKFDKTWKGLRTDLHDDVSYDFSVAHYCERAGMSEQEIANAIVQRHTNHSSASPPDQLSARYLQHVIDKVRNAVAGGKGEKEVVATAAIDADASIDGRSDVDKLALVRRQLGGLDILRIVKYGAVKAGYWAELNDGDSLELGEQLSRMSTQDRLRDDVGDLTKGRCLLPLYNRIQWNVVAGNMMRVAVEVDLPDGSDIAQVAEIIDEQRSLAIRSPDVSDALEQGQPFWDDDWLCLAIPTLQRLLDTGRGIRMTSRRIGAHLRNLGYIPKSYRFRESTKHRWLEHKRRPYCE